MMSGTNGGAKGDKGLVKSVAETLSAAAHAIRFQ